MLISDNRSTSRWEARSSASSSCCCCCSPHHRVSSSAVPFVFSPRPSASCGINGPRAAVTSSGPMCGRSPVAETSPPPRYVWCFGTDTQREQLHFSLAKQALLVAWMCEVAWCCVQVLLVTFNTKLHFSSLLKTALQPQHLCSHKPQGKRERWAVIWKYKNNLDHYQILKKKTNGIDKDIAISA